MTDKVIPLEELGKRGTVKVYNQAYVDKLELKIKKLIQHLEPQTMTALFEQVEEETKQEELLNSTLEENKEIYKKMADLDTAFEDCTESLTDARIKIKELEKENAELKDKLSNLASVAEVRLANWQKYEKENAELKKQIEKMKCCQNCKFEDNDCIEEPCSSCSRCLGDIKRKGNSDKWELQED